MAMPPLLQVIKQMVDRAGLRPDRLLLVGGFGFSPYLRDKLEARFGERVLSARTLHAALFTPPLTPFRFDRPAGNSMGDLTCLPNGCSAMAEGAARYLKHGNDLSR